MTAPQTPAGAIGEQLSFLPPPPMCPTWPKPGTLAERALGMMLDGEQINHPQFENRTQSWRLSAAIYTLRTLGWPVQTFDLHSPTGSDPHRTIAAYFLHPRDVVMALMHGGCD